MTEKVVRLKRSVQDLMLLINGGALIVGYDIIGDATRVVVYCDSSQLTCEVVDKKTHVELRISQGKN